MSTTVIKAVRLLGFAFLMFAVPAAHPAPAADGPRIAVLGDSLTAGFGVEVSEAFPVRLEAALRAAGVPATVLNAGVSGDTSAGGLARLDWTLAGEPGQTPDHVIVALGANDGMRGLDPGAMYDNLAAILEGLAARGVRALIAGMRAPPNLGRDYAQEFEAVYPRLAEAYDVPLYPFFLEGVAADPSLNQTDGIHPNPAGVEVMVARMLPMVLHWLAAP